MAIVALFSEPQWSSRCYRLDMVFALPVGQHGLHGTICGIDIGSVLIFSRYGPRRFFGVAMAPAFLQNRRGFRVTF